MLFVQCCSGMPGEEVSQELFGIASWQEGVCVCSQCLAILLASQSQGMSSCVSEVSHHPPRRSSEVEARWSFSCIKAHVFLLWKNPEVRKQITPWSQIWLCLGVAQVRLWCFNLSKSGNSSGSSSVLDPGSGDSVGASPADVLVRNESPQQSPRDVASLLPPSPCQAKVPNSVPSCSDFQIAASHCAARGSPVLLHFITWDPLITLLALCILWMIIAHSGALAGPPPSCEK